jgi:hypothetical protein
MGLSLRTRHPLFFCLSLTTLASPAFAEDSADEGSTVPVAAPPEPAAVPAEGGVFVHLRADDPRATLERRTKVETYSGLPIQDASIAGVATWTPECIAPCEKPIDPKYAYRVAGDGLVPSSTLVLPRSGDVTVEARMGSAYQRLGGLALVGTGAGGVLLGVAALAVSPILANDDVGSPGVRSGIVAGGAALTGLGVLALGAGLWLWASNDTRVFPDPTRGIVF